MERLLAYFLACFLSLASLTLAAPLQEHQSGGFEHIVIIDKNHPTPPGVAEVLSRLALNETHPDVHHVFNNSAFQGFAASMKSHCLDLLANMSDVSMVEQAALVSKGTISKRAAKGYSTRDNAPWGLQRISSSSAVGGSASDMDFTYSYVETSLGAGSDIYILDTGIYISHNVFNGRASMLWSYNGDMQDSDGHGTHVSGTAAGDVLGVASNAKIYGIKTLDSEGGGWSSNVVAGIDYVIQRHDARKAKGDTFTGSVISMSLASSSPVEAINQAVNAAVAAGVHVCVAAGNDGQDACQSSPASAGGTHGGAITVGAVDMQAARASFSNHGACVDIYAPGVDIVSAWIGAPNVINSLSGTSMATPHVTGIIAYAMANATLAADPGLMKEWIRMVALSTKDGSLLANNGVQAQGGGKGGMLGYDKISGGPSWLAAGATSRRAKRGLVGCTDDVWTSPAVGAWLCNVRRSWASVAGNLQGR